MKASIQQRKQAHSQRKAAAIRKETGRYRDGKGKARVLASQKRANGTI